MTPHATPPEYTGDLTRRSSDIFFIELLDIMYQNPGTGISELMESQDFSFAKSDAVSDKAEKNYAEFEI